MPVPASHILHELSKPEPNFLRRFHGGDFEGARDEFMEIAYPYLVAYPPDLLRGASLGERHDLAMDVIERLLKVEAKPLLSYQGRPRAPFAAFLRQVARNLAIDWKKRQSKHISDESLALQSHPDPDPEGRRRREEKHEVRMKRLARRAQELIDTVSNPECRSLLIWRLRDRNSFREMALMRRRGETASTVGKRFYACRDRLRRDLEKAEDVDLRDLLEHDFAE